MNNKSIILALLALLLLPLLPLASLRAQDPMSLYFMETIPQLNRVNPAMQPRTNAFVSLPSVNFTVNSDLAFKDFLQKSGGKTLIPIDDGFNYNKLYRRMGKSWNLDMGTEIGLIGFGFRTSKGKGYFTFSTSIKVDMRNDVPAHLFKLPENGITGALDYSTMRFKTIAYKQLSIGYSREFGDRLTLGANLRPLFGLAAISTDIRQFDINFLREGWDVALTADVYSSGPIDVTPKENNNFPDIALRNLDIDDAIKYGTSLANPGIAIDLGAVYKLTDRLELSAALNNLGFISWNKDLFSISGRGSFNFEGIEINDPNTNFDAFFDDLTEQFETALDYESATGKRFTTSLTPSVYLGASYQLTQSITAGLLSRSMIMQNGIRQEFNLSANYQPLKIFSFGFGINQQLRGGTSIGTSSSINIGPFQIYTLADMPLMRLSYISFSEDGKAPTAGKFVSLNDIDRMSKGEFIPIPAGFKGMTFMIGFNLVFGKKGYRDRPMLDR